MMDISGLVVILCITGFILAVGFAMYAYFKQLQAQFNLNEVISVRNKEAKLFKSAIDKYKEAERIREEYVLTLEDDYTKLKSALGDKDV